MSLESRVFEEELGNLTSVLLGLDYGQFGHSLAGNGIITQTALNAVLSAVGSSRRDQVDRLAKAMLEQVKQNVDRFDSLILLMKTEPAMDALASRMLQTYWGRGGRRCGEWKPADPPQPQPSRSKGQPEPSRPMVQPQPSRSKGQPELSRPLQSAEPVSSGGVPETPELLNEVAAVIPAKWRAVGTMLKVPSGMLDAIQAQGHGAPNAGLHCFGYMLEEWRSRRTCPYTWDTLISVLRSTSVGEVALAEKLAKTHGCCLGNVPTIEELEKFTVNGDTVTIMTDVAQRWKEICVAFNFDPTQRTAQKIEQRFCGNPAQCCREMFQLWLKTDGASWDSLINVLDNCKERLLASQVKAYVRAGK